MPSSRATFGFPSTAPPPVCVSAALGMLDVWIPHHTKKIEWTYPAGVMFREELVHQRTCLRDFPPGNTESDKPPLLVLHVETLRPSNPC